MRRESLNELFQAHARLCRELQVRREDLAGALREMHGRMVTARDVRKHTEKEQAIEEVNRQLSTVALKIAGQTR
jgi:hypothetical protein